MGIASTDAIRPSRLGGFPPAREDVHAGSSVVARPCRANMLAPSLFAAYSMLRELTCSGWPSCRRRFAVPIRLQAPRAERHGCTRVVRPISADVPRHRTLPVCVDHCLTVYYYSADRCIAKREGHSHCSHFAVGSARHHVPIHRARFCRRQLVARLGPHSHCVPRMERKQHPHQRNHVGHGPRYQARIAWNQL
jgi:hypothetical protein